MRPLGEGRPRAQDDEHFARVVTAAFGQRRKTLRNALKGLVPDELLASCGIDPGARAEEIPVEAYGRLAASMQGVPKAEGPDA